MNTRFALVMSCVLVALATAAAAQGYTKPTDPSSVAVAGCAAQGGTATVPADTPITVYAGWGAKTRGQVQDWLNASTNTLSVGGGPAVDMSPYFAGITHEFVPPDWADIFFYGIGTLAAGHSTTVVWTSSTSRPTPDGSTQGIGHPQPTDLTFSCTITAV